MEVGEEVNYPLRSRVAGESAQKEHSLSKWLFVRACAHSHSFSADKAVNNKRETLTSASK